ncbi:MAG: trehalose-phosphatase, partial [Hyphomicrobiaceae bacterium]
LGLIHGKMVIEARQRGSNKGDAVGAFLSEPPFQGLVPLFAGDDVTDEDAFRVVNELKGISIKIGPGETLAAYRLPDTAAFLAWLAELSATDAEDGSGAGE